MVNIGVASNEKIELYQEDGKYYLRLDFDYENSDGYYKGHVERILFDFHLCSINRLLSEYGQKTTINLGVEKNMELLPDEDGNYFTCELIKYKTREMTLEEIEDKLGYKVKIVENK